LCQPFPYLQRTVIKPIVGAQSHHNHGERPERFDVFESTELDGTARAILFCPKELGIQLIEATRYALVFG
jgi:hypothetical protein